MIEIWILVLLMDPYVPVVMVATSEEVCQEFRAEVVEATPEAQVSKCLSVEIPAS